MWDYSLPTLPRTSKCPFLRVFWYFLLSVNCIFPLLIMSMAHFSRPNSIPISWIYILIVGLRISNSFSFFFSFWKQLAVVYVHLVVNLFLWLTKFVCDWVATLLLQIVMVTGHLPGIYLSGIFPELSFFSSCQFHFSVFHGFRHNLYILKQSIFQPYGTYRRPLLSIPAITTFSFCFFALLRGMLINVQ